MAVAVALLAGWAQAGTTFCLFTFPLSGARPATERGGREWAGLTAASDRKSVTPLRNIDKTLFSNKSRWTSSSTAGAISWFSILSPASASDLFWRRKSLSWWCGSHLVSLSSRPRISREEEVAKVFYRSITVPIVDRHCSRIILFFLPCCRVILRLTTAHSARCIMNMSAAGRNGGEREDGNTH